MALAYAYSYQGVNVKELIEIKLQVCQFCNTWLGLCAFRDLP
jgi:formate dehydrogenase maturation protein FdhE